MVQGAPLRHRGFSVKMAFKIVGLAVTSALALSLAVAPAATAEDYPPAITANGPSNPPNPEQPNRVAASVVVVSKATALAATPRYFVFRAAPNLKDAPQADRRTKSGKFVPIYRVGQVVRLVARVPASQTYAMSIRVNGKWVAVGNGTSDANGRLSMVAFGASKATAYPYRFVSASTDKTFYVQVNLAGPRKREGVPLETLRVG
jgi:hypothetical protein